MGNLTRVTGLNFDYRNENGETLSNPKGIWAEQKVPFI